MRLKTDDAVYHHVLSHNPLRGSILLDYFYAGDQTKVPTLVMGTMRDGKFPPKKELEIDKAIGNFWRLFNTWVVPTVYQYNTWIRDLCRHALAMHETYNIGLGPLKDAQFMVVSLYNAGMLNQYGYSDEKDLEEEYARIAKGSVRAAIVNFLGYVRRDKDTRYDMRGKNVEFLHVLQNHIRGIVKDVLLGELKAQLTEDSMNAYVASFKKDFPDDGNAWLSAPQLIYCMGADGPGHTMVPFHDAPTDIIKPGSNDWKKIVYYSNIGQGLFNGVDYVARQLLDNRGLSGIRVNDLHGTWGFFDVDDRDATIEAFNYHVFRHYKKRGQALGARPAAAAQPIAMDVDEGKGAKDKKGAVKKNDQTALLLVAAGVVAAMVYA